jgi:hypothetical protein
MPLCHHLSFDLLFHPYRPLPETLVNVIGVPVVCLVYERLIIETTTQEATIRLAYFLGTRGVTVFCGQIEESVAGAHRFFCEPRPVWVVAFVIHSGDTAIPNGSAPGGRVTSTSCVTNRLTCSEHPPVTY